MRPGLSRPALLPFLPVLVLQGRQVSRRVPRLPDADRTHGEIAGVEPAWHVVVVGDSVAAGVGVADHADTVAGQAARRLHGRDGRRARWDVIARSGADAEEVSRLTGEPEAVDVLGRADLVVVSIGVNDTKGLTSDAAWSRGLTNVLRGVVEGVRQDCRVVLLGMPPMEVFPSLPRALARIVGARARRLDAIGREVAERSPRVERLEFDRAHLTAVAEPFAADGFHPSAALHAALAEWIVADRGAGGLQLHSL